MKQAALSMLAYAIYLTGLGATLVVAPNVVLPIFGLAETHEVWIHILGWTVLILALLYGLAGRNENRETMMVSIAVRLSIPFVFAAFVIAGLAPWNLILLTTGDIAFALWTWSALRRAPAAA